MNNSLSSRSVVKNKELARLNFKYFSPQNRRNELKELSKRIDKNALDADQDLKDTMRQWDKINQRDRYSKNSV